MNAKQLLHVLTPVVAVTAFALSAQAWSIDEDFESYVAGSDLHGQLGWKGWDNAAGAGAKVSTAFSFDGNQSVNITGGSDLVHGFSGLGFPTLQYTFSIRQFVPSTSTGTSYFILLNTYNDGGPYDWSIQIPFNLDAGTVKADETGTAGGTFNTLSIAKDQWALIQVMMDFSTPKGSMTTLYNGQVLVVDEWQDGGVNALAAIDLYANGADPVYYDSLKFEAGLIPEPAPIALLGLGALALVLRRKVS